MSKKQIVYLDYNATTPCAPEVVEAMLPFFNTQFGNASSGHSMGRKAAEAVGVARDHIARLVGCGPDDLFFTSGATESNNLVLLGLIQGRAAKRRMVVGSIEHKSVLEPCRRLSEQGFEVCQIPVTRDGVIDILAAERLIDDETLLVSAQAANNELGTVQPIKALADVAHSHNALVHCDATQMLGKVPISVLDMDVDFASFSSHKTYGPKGVGVFYMRGGSARATIEPLILGGGQESAIRAGTLNVPAIVGFGEACQVAFKCLQGDVLRITMLRDFLEEEILKQIPDAFAIGTSVERLPGTSSVFIRDVPADALISRMPLLCIGTGSACTSGAPSPSHVLVACGYSRDSARCVIRVSLGRYTTRGEVEFAVKYLAENVNAIRDYAVDHTNAASLTQKASGL
jgi:cysteine desulfurase